MDVTPKEKRKGDEPEKDDDPTWEKDQKERGYYYDDAHGYTRYVPEDDVEETEKNEEK